MYTHMDTHASFTHTHTHTRTRIHTLTRIHRHTHTDVDTHTRTIPLIRQMHWEYCATRQIPYSQ
uniref:Uncharacterized protein n=1 Tax=Anguilla anguilla TaxID=7936 RepID=A0A0E9PQI8_ANGAN